MDALQTLQQLVQDVIAPDADELKLPLGLPEKQMDDRFDAAERRFEFFERKCDVRLMALRSTIAESWSQVDTANMRVIPAPRERVAVLECQRH